VDVSFMVRSADSTLVTTHEGLKFCSSAAVAECLRTRYKFKRAITAPFTRSSCRGRVFALDSMCLAHSQLSMVEIVADRVGLELEHHSLQQQAELAAVERERSNLAHNLHDGILQSLTAATLQLKVCRTKAPGRIRQNLGSLQKLLEAEQKRVRNFVNGQRDKIDVHNDDKCSLASASEGVLIEVGAYWCCETPLSVVPADATVPSAFTEHLWLILAEAVANAARHGQASRVIVDLERTTEALAISVSDNGKGFSGLAGTYTDEELTAEHVGPHFLCDRVRTLQGKLMLSTSSAGSRLQIRLPLH
jgi:signal transduction histidine kinase